MKKIIVTGGLGFIGSNLAKLLIKKNYFVINVDKVNYASNFYNTRDFFNKKNYKFIKLDINNRSKLRKVLNLHKPIAVFNLAAETHVDRSIDGPAEFIKSNIVGVFNLLEEFREFTKKNKKSKLIHISTDEVYGDVLKGRSKENDPYKPSSPYAASKASSDHLVYSYVRTFKLNAMITNCSNNYGPHQHPEKLIPKLIYNIIKNKPLPLYGKGKNSREWIFVDDHCEALFKVFKNGAKGQFYNIGSNINRSNLDIAKLLINIAKKKTKLGKKVKIKFVKDRPGHDVRYALDSKKIFKRLKWKSKINLKKGLENTFNWYFKNMKYYTTLKKKDITRRLGVVK
ncbi:dTDP-glucose 4,6-dehydratase [Candidatus Pelagibacter communis]|uniref:dTDP-glucose 4,6-dehydratase n=1 Tax=Pelagibacter ubique TaxID=198252 RepID=UPI00094D78B4|nr:dTDP-glucose 4,6-dehydratase [Candidatus Pelagibacter ubique]